MEIKLPLPVAPTANAGSAVSPAVAEGAARTAPTSASAPQSVAPLHIREAAPRQLQQSVEELQHKVQLTAPNLQFSIDHDTGRTVVKVIDANTNELIRQIPPDEILRLAKEIDRMRGLLLHQQG